jgi:hypothetical protein
MNLWRSAAWAFLVGRSAWAFGGARLMVSFSSPTLFRRPRKETL